MKIKNTYKCIKLLNTQIHLKYLNKYSLPVFVVDEIFHSMHPQLVGVAIIKLLMLLLLLYGGMIYHQTK